MGKESLCEEGPTMNNEHTTDPERNASEYRNGSFPWMDKSLTARERADKLVAATTLEQKITPLHCAMETMNIYELASADKMNDMSP